MLTVNGFRNVGAAIQQRGFVSASGGYQKAQYSETGRLMGFRVPEVAQALLPLCAIPFGTSPPTCWLLPIRAGAMVSRGEVVGTGELVAAGTRGLNGTAALSGTSTLSGLGTLIAALTAAIGGTSALVAALSGLVEGTASLSGSSTLTAAATGTGAMSAAVAGTSAVTGAASGIGNMTAAIDNTSALTAGDIATEILDRQLVELGMTVRQALRLVSAATAGKVSISGTTVTIRNAVADTDDRIVAITDGAGQRTAITYDLD